MARYEDRRHAGQVLAEALKHYKGRSHLEILALPRGGVPVGYEVARALGAPLEVFIVRKLGVPGYEELAMGAIASGGAQVLSRPLILRLGIPEKAIASAIAREREELARRERVYRGERAPLQLEGKTVILVDDGLATGSTMRAAAAGLQALKPARLVVAVPVAARETCEELAGEVDEVVCAATPDPFVSVGSWYEDFTQTEDDEVHALLAQSAASESAHAE